MPKYEDTTDTEGEYEVYFLDFFMRYESSAKVHAIAF